MPCLAPSALLGRLPGLTTGLSPSFLRDCDAAEPPNQLLPQLESGSTVLSGGTAIGKGELGGVVTPSQQIFLCTAPVAASAEVTITRARSFYGFTQF